MKRRLVRVKLCPTIVEVYDDRSYKLFYKTEPASQMTLKALGKEKGSGKPNTDKIGLPEPFSFFKAFKIICEAGSVL